MTTVTLLSRKTSASSMPMFRWIVAAFASVLAAILIVTAVHQSIINYRLNTGGVRTVGVAVNKWMGYSRKGRQSYLFSYRFRLPGGGMHQERVFFGQVSKEDYEAVGIGGPIPVVYLPRDPSINAIVFDDLIEERKTFGHPICIAFLSGLFLIGFSWFIGYAPLLPRR